MLITKDSCGKKVMVHFLSANRINTQLFNIYSNKRLIIKTERRRMSFPFFLKKMDTAGMKKQER